MTTSKRWDPRVEPPPACPRLLDGRRPNLHEVEEVGSLGLEIGTGYECHGCWLRFMVTTKGEIVEGWGEPAPGWVQDLAP